MGASCCQKTVVQASHEIVYDENAHQPYPASKQTVLQIGDNNNDPLIQEYSKEENQSKLEFVRKSMPALKISNTKGTLMIVNNAVDSDEEVEIEKSGEILQESIDQSAPMNKNQESTLHQHSIKEQSLKQEVKPPDSSTLKKGNSGSAIIVSSPQSGSLIQKQDPSNGDSRKQSMASINSKSMKLGVDLFVNLKKGSISKTYTTGQVLGQGAFGKVWKVTHKTTGLVRAMKQIKKAELIKEEEQKLFQEMNVLKNLDHPHIVKLYEFYQDATSYYLITEYLSGGELFDRIKKMTHFSESKASDYMRQILMAVVYCHERKIVHRDLKPENVLFITSDPNSELKLIDFGCSRKLTGKTMTKRLGTPYYIAPEVLSQKYNEKCDVWSCGVIMYILLCGYPPFTGRSENEIFEKVKAGKVRFARKIDYIIAEDWDGISKEAKSLISKMLTVDPLTRYSAAQALSDNWISKHAPATQIDKKVLDQLSSFQVKSPNQRQAKSYFRQAVCQYIVAQMSTSKELEDLKKAFQSLDKNHDGILTKDELVEGYTKILKSKQQALEQVEKILEFADANHSGIMDYSEFISSAMKQENIISLKKVEQAFKIFDQDGDGFITKQELESVMGELDEIAWQQILAETDANGDGKISQDEFQQILMNYKL